MNGPVLLHVEDDESDIRIVARSLALAGQPVCIVNAIDGRHAIESLREIAEGVAPRPDVILLDLKLPFVSGLELLRKAKASPALKDIPVVILTSSNAPQDRNQCEDAGCAEYCVKPIEYTEFVSLVQALGRRYLQALTTSLVSLI